MNETEIPIVCTLSDADFRRREQEVIARLMPRVVEWVETADGFAYIFPGDDDTLIEVAEFIRLERQCCPFLTFELRVPHDKDNISLNLTGPKGAKEFIARTFK